MALAGIVLMVIGYRGTDNIPVYTPLPGMGHLNNLLMLFSFFFLGAGSMKGWVASKVRHNMLTGLFIWAIAHLLVNGDLASVILFGSMAVYALFSMFLISRAVPLDRPAPGPIKKDLMNSQPAHWFCTACSPCIYIMARLQPIPGNLRMRQPQTAYRAVQFRARTKP